MRRARLLAGATLVVALVGGLTWPADAGTSPLEARIAAREGARFRPRLAFDLDAGDAKSFSVKVKNRSDDRYVVTLFAALNAEPGYTEKYFKGDDNITDEVSNSDGFEFGLGPDRAKRFRLRVRVTNGESPEERCLGSHFDPTVRVPDDGESVYLELNGDCD